VRAALKVGDETDMLEVWGRRSSFNVQIAYRALRKREAFRTHIMIPFGELRGRLLDF